MTAPLYVAEGIEQRFGGKVALTLPSLTLSEGRIYTLAGPNGSGKTTLLATLAFLVTPASGRLWFRGARVAWGRAALLALRREVTLVHQFPFLFAGTVAENVALGLRQRGVAPDEVRVRVAAALARVGLGALAARDAKLLSGGEAQRIAVARALVLEPRVLLLDEPFANLDSNSEAAVEALVLERQAAGGTIILSSHDANHARRLRSEVVHLRAGCVVRAEGVRETSGRSA